MSRIAPPVVRGPLLRLTHHLTKRKLGRMVEPVAVQAHTPRLLMGYGAFEQAALKPRFIGRRLRQLAVLKAATVVGCEFCIDIGSHLARESGLSGQHLLALARHRESDLFTPLEQLVLDYAAAVSRTPVDVPDELFEALRAELSAPQLVELTSLIALENYRARFNGALEIGSAGFSDGMVCATSAPP